MAIPLNVDHPNFGQQYRLSRAAIRLRTFTVAELQEMTEVTENTIYAFISALGDYLHGEDLKRGTRGRPSKRYTLTTEGVDFLLKRNAQLTSILRETLPPINRPASVREPRKFRPEDLLSRNTVNLDLGKIRGRLENKVLLITGAGGSLGSELTLQAAMLGPRQVVLVARSEN